MGPGFTVRHFKIGADHARGWGWHADASEEFSGAECIFPRWVLTGQDEKIVCSNSACPLCTRNLKGRIQGDKRRGQIRGMNNIAWPPAKDRVLLILAINRETLVAVCLETLESIAIIPAPGPLGNIAGQRRHIAYLRCSHTRCRLT